MKSKSRVVSSYHKFMALLDHWANHGVPQMLGVAISFVSVTLGVSMILNPGVFLETYTFQEVFAFASPQAWATVYIFTAILVLITVFTSQKSAQAPVFVMAATFVVQGLLTIPMIAVGGVPSSLFMYIGMGWICIITQLVCGAREVPRDQTPVHH